MMKYAKNVAEWAHREGVKEVIVLSGLDSGKRQRHEMDLYVLKHPIANSNHVFMLLQFGHSYILCVTS